MFQRSISIQFARFRKQPKITKKNIKELIQQEKKKIQEKKKKFQTLVQKDFQLNQTIIDLSSQSHAIWKQLQDINQGRLQAPFLRNLKAQIIQVLQDCIQSGAIINLRSLANLNESDLANFMRQLEAQRQGYKKEFIEKMPFFLHQMGKNSQKDDMCSICHEQYAENVECIKLLCNHVFHRKCISHWLKLKKNCPLCKQLVKGAKANNLSLDGSNPSSSNDQNVRPNHL